ncbi:unnamed protein product [Rotaria sp. Silwood2]|nr:unnamed protein product [Rotaria sp. Silwood2]
MKFTDFSLTSFDYVDYIWVPISDADGYTTITDLQLPSYTTLNVEKIEEANTKIHHTSKIRDKNLTVKLCKQSMNKTDFEYLNVDSSITIGQLKEEARKRVISQRTKYLYLWTENGWTKFDTNLDDLTLAEMKFNQYSMISFQRQDDLVPGLCGLTNLGNTCFMNSALQCLSNIPEFTRKILLFGNEINAPIIGAYSALIKTMWSGEHIVTVPSSLLLNISENLPRFRRYRQQDAQEFMNYFLTIIHQELTNERTLITDLFYGQIQSSVKCLGGCHFIETNAEVISFLPLPVANDIDQYDILYLRSNGEQKLISVHVCARTIGTLIESFIKQHEPKLSSTRIQVVRIVDNIIIDNYSSYTLLSDTIKHQLTFIELPEKTVDQRYVELAFLSHRTYKPFRPPIFLVCPSYGCHYSDLFEQINQIQNYLCSVTNAPTFVFHRYWINDKGTTCNFKTETHKDDTSLLFMNRIILEMDPEWIEKYINLYNIDRSSINSSLNSLLADFFREEPLNGVYYCSKCLDLKTARQKADLVLPLPPVLIIQLKRFTYDPYSSTKIDTYIDFPLRDLDLHPYIIQNDGQKKNMSTLYDLVAVSNHRGSLVSGHYITYARNDRNKNWYSFDDETIREILNEHDIVTKDAYILVYVQRPTM